MPDLMCSPEWRVLAIERRWYHKHLTLAFILTLTHKQHSLTVTLTLTLTLALTLTFTHAHCHTSQLSLQRMHTINVCGDYGLEITSFVQLCQSHMRVVGHSLCCCVRRNKRSKSRKWLTSSKLISSLGVTPCAFNVHIPFGPALVSLMLRSIHLQYWIQTSVVRNPGCSRDASTSFYHKVLWLLQQLICSSISDFRLSNWYTNSCKKFGLGLNKVLFVAHLRAKVIRIFLSLNQQIRNGWRKCFKSRTLCSLMVVGLRLEALLLSWSANDMSQWCYSHAIEIFAN